MTLQEHILSFLNQHNIAKKFLANRSNPDLVIGRYTANNRYFKVDLFKAAFPWRNTSEGGTYWKKMHAQWLHYCTHNNVPYGTINYSSICKAIKKQLRPLTNEEIFVVFLKEHRLFSSWKRSFSNPSIRGFYSRVAASRPSSINSAVNDSFVWSKAEKREVWQKVHRKWHLLVKTYNLEGTLEYEKVLNSK